MPEEINSFPVFMVSHEERTVSGTLSDKSYIDGSNVISMESEISDVQEDYLTRIGTAQMQKDGSIYVQIYSMPLNGKIIIKTTKS
jgi:hypothetical protein